MLSTNVVNEWMLNDTPAQKLNQLFGVKQKVFT